MRGAYTDDAVVIEIGHRLQRERLNQNLSQAALAKLAGVSRKTITNLENGAGGTLGTLVAVLRGLNKLAALESFLPDPGVSPMQLLKLEGKVRQRASGKHKRGDSGVVKEVDGKWEWDD
ncbi:helix-turn-helix transcriptional regulator [Verrucomicrobiales bacterium BCK34]|nr:helix-turn-helix transcriptional regulator [Verrucomicrobiales bacterium BCK34]